MRRVFITGGTGSIGRALLRAFSGAKYEVRFQYYTQVSEAQSLADATGAVGNSCDLSSFSAVSEIDLHDVDILINNAGINISRSMTAEVKASDWNQTLAVNLTAPFLLCRNALPGMTARRWGRIINISSIYGLRSSEENLPYVVSKHGLCGLTKTIAREYGAYGITANDICPGPVDSDLLNRIAIHYEGNKDDEVKEYLRGITESIPVGRLAAPEDIAQVALFIASDAAEYLNGTSLPVDGDMIA